MFGTNDDGGTKINLLDKNNLPIVKRKSQAGRLIIMNIGSIDFVKNIVQRSRGCDLVKQPSGTS